MASSSTDSNLDVESDPLPPPTRRRMAGPDYTPAELAEKEACMRRLSIEYPDLTAWHHELVYDFCATTPQAQIDEIIESGKWENTPSKFCPGATKKIIDAVKQIST